MNIQRKIQVLSVLLILTILCLIIPLPYILLQKNGDLNTMYHLLVITYNSQISNLITIIQMHSNF